MWGLLRSIQFTVCLQKTARTGKRISTKPIQYIKAEDGRHGTGKDVDMRKVYILLKDTPELYKGAVLQEQCNDGTQDFECISEESEKFTNTTSVFDRVVVIKSPEWFRKATLSEMGNIFIKKFAK